MQNVIPHFKIFPIRSPKWIIFSGGLLFFCLITPGQSTSSQSFALATPIAIEKQAQIDSIQLTAKTPTPISQKAMLPQAIADKVLQDLAQRTDQPTSVFKIESSEATQWPNSCLGLAKPDEFCAQMITPGWRIEVNDGKKTWTYRTDQRGKNIRLES